MTNLLLVIAIAVASVLVLSLMFSMWLSTPPVDVAMQLVDHPKVHRVAEEDEAA